MENQVFNSWEIINEMTIIKKADWSFFKYNGSGIPKATRNYWNINNLSSGEKLHIILNYKGVEYESYIVIDKTRFQRSQIFWNSDLGNIFKLLYPNYNNKNDLDYPSLQFKKISNTYYIISFVNEINDDYLFLPPNYSNIEGRKLYFQSTRYERDAKLRQQALNIHGYSCFVCGFNFFETYGEIGRQFIHVHHINPLSQIGEQSVNPITDLVPVCPNCHCMIHRDKKYILTIEELKQILKINGK